MYLFTTEYNGHSVSGECNCNICYLVYSILCLLSHLYLYVLLLKYRSLVLRQENGKRLDVISGGLILDPTIANVQEVEGGQQGNVIIKLPSYFYDGDTAEANVMAIGVLM